MNHKIFVFILLFCAFFWLNSEIFPQNIHSGFIQSFRRAEILFSGKTMPDFSDWQITPGVDIEKIEIEDSIAVIFTVQPFELHQHYFLQTGNSDSLFLIPDGILDSLYSDKILGYIPGKNSTSFRIFAPRAIWVKLVLYEDHQSSHGQEYIMFRDTEGVWDLTLDENLSGWYYGYRIWGPGGNGEMFDSTIVLADPYSPAVVTMNHYTHPAKTLILSHELFNWGGESWKETNPGDLIIYEMHIRDLTAHRSSGLPEAQRGSYTALIKPAQEGGISYIRSLGVNAVELLPSQDFGNIEVPYKDPDAPVFNTWNPYARNHWGYMTSYFFAPESYYESGGTMEDWHYNGEEGRQVTEFKQMVKEFHRNDMAVLMDVVYNHVAQYDHNPFKYIDKFYYFRLNEDCSFTSVSGCGNDFKSERPMARRLIIDSIVHWMTDYHIDGFRFDLALLIDWQTIDAIRHAATKVNPNVILIAEPWGGGYNPEGFSDHRWASWNDQIRNGVKGQNPHDELGFIFGKWQGINNQESLKRYVMGSLREYGGQYLETHHSVNYLESHDDYTLGDFIRIGLGDVKSDKLITDPLENARLTPEQMQVNKLAALFLFTCQGPVMIHEGQEYGRSKVIAPTEVPDPNVGKIDHNSYEKDNETNWLNFDHAKMNRELIDYYRGLIRMRNNHAAFRTATPEQFTFFPVPDSLFLAYEIKHDTGRYIVLLNGNDFLTNKFIFPEGNWKILADGIRADSKPFRLIQNRNILVPPGSGMVLIAEE